MSGVTPSLTNGARPHLGERLESVQHSKHGRRRKRARACVRRDKRVRLVCVRAERVAAASEADRDAADIARRWGRIRSKEPKVDAAAAARAWEDGAGLPTHRVLQNAVSIKPPTIRGRRARQLTRRDIRSVAAPDVVLRPVAIGPRIIPPEARSVFDPGHGGRRDRGSGTGGRPNTRLEPSKRILDDGAGCALGCAAGTRITGKRECREDVPS